MCSIESVLKCPCSKNAAPVLDFLLLGGNLWGSRSGTPHRVPLLQRSVLLSGPPCTHAYEEEKAHVVATNTSLCRRQYRNSIPVSQKDVQMAA